jgi:SAM-dependent methyltransferase
MTLEAQTKAAATYSAAADFYDDPANAFWNRFGQRTVEGLSLPRDARVLDVCCGSGASAIPAAEQIGPRGSVLGIDLADQLLALAPWDRICEPDALRARFDGSGVVSLEVGAEAATHPIRSADDWWSMVLGSGYRGTIELLGAEDQARVRTECSAFIREANVQCVETNVVYAIATRAF